MLIAPHGGDRLVDRFATAAEATRLRDLLANAPAIVLDEVAAADLEMLACGGYSPLEGFMGAADRQRVAQQMRLRNGTLWPIPITLGVSAQTKARLRIGAQVPLHTAGGRMVGVLDLQEIYERDIAEEVRLVYGTDDPAHPGVAQLLARGPICVAGPVTVFALDTHVDFADRRLAPAQTRQAFAQRGWSRVVGFQTRNPIHRAHEYLLKCALEICDGLFIHPLVGFTKSDDIPADVRMRCYQVLIDGYIPKDRVHLSVLPAPMRYAGPREAVLHAIVRKNYGCTHFIVGRDHAGVGSYYGTYDAQRIFDTFPARDLGIEPLCFEHAFFCHRCDQMVSTKTCPHDKREHVFLSGTKVRELLQAGERPSAHFSRPEVADVLIEWARK